MSLAKKKKKKKKNASHAKTHYSNEYLYIHQPNNECVRFSNTAVGSCGLCTAKVMRSDRFVRMRRLVRARVLRLCHEVRFSLLRFIGKGFGSVFTLGEGIYSNCVKIGTYNRIILINI